MHARFLHVTQRGQYGIDLEFTSAGPRIFVHQVSVADHEGVDSFISHINLPGVSFGELSLMYGKPRTATVTCVVDGWLWCLERKAFRGILVDKMTHDNTVKILRKVNKSCYFPENAVPGMQGLRGRRTSLRRHGVCITFHPKFVQEWFRFDCTTFFSSETMYFAPDAFTCSAHRKRGSVISVFIFKGEEERTVILRRWHHAFRLYDTDELMHCVDSWFLRVPRSRR